MVHRVPVALSPSSLGTFTKCPLAFRFSYIERLPEPPSPAASKGTLVHLALQHLMWRPAAERTREAALDDLSRARAELASDPDLTGLELTDAEWDRFHADAEALLHRYFELEDPATIRAIGLELRVHAQVAPGVRMRGVIDRLELDDDGELVITDYKTGKPPPPQRLQESL
ncbi:MAG: RecB family exonuclease, partial [Actinomycetota bacterium]